MFAQVIDRGRAGRERAEEWLADPDDRKVITSLLNMAVSRHAHHRGLKEDNERRHRFFFPHKEGLSWSITWKPLHNTVSREVAGRRRGPKGEFWRHAAAYLTLLAEPLAVRPSFDTLVERVFRNFTGIEIPKAERPEGLIFELILTPDEAMRGVEVPIGLPRVESCHECGGIGRVWLFPCASCGGQRVIITERIVRIQVPPLARPESVIEVPLHGVVIHSLYLRLHVRVE